MLIPLLILDAASACKNIPCPVFDIARIIVNMLKIVVPIIIIVLGMIDFAKATASGEDEMVKARKAFIHRLLSGATVFVVVSIVQLVFALFGRGETTASQIFKCASGIVGGEKYTDAQKNSGNFCFNDEFCEKEPCLQPKKK